MKTAVYFKEELRHHNRARTKRQSQCGHDATFAIILSKARMSTYI